ncbi:hypothetical protein D3C76_1221620 [compost metagenome]
MMNGTIAKNEMNSAVRYTHQCSSFGRPPRSTKARGRATKLAMRMACRMKIPTSRRRRSAWRRVGPSAWRATPDSRCCRVLWELGTTKAISRIPTKASPAVARNNPDKPKALVNSGPTTMATANDRPMLMPIMAMALVRCCSRVRSDSSAMTAAEIAPAPCRMRPAITPQIESAWAAKMLPRAKITSPR